MKKIRHLATVFAWLVVNGVYTLSDFEGTFKEEVKMALIAIGFPDLAEEGK